MSGEIHIYDVSGMRRITEEGTMADNFKIVFHPYGENLHLKLFGDFDGHSAVTLLRVLKNSAFFISRIFIHTACVNLMSPSAVEIFKNNLSALSKMPVSYEFTGKYAHQLALGMDKSFNVIPG